MEDRKLLLDWLYELNKDVCATFVQVLIALQHDKTAFKYFLNYYKPLGKVQASVDFIFNWDEVNTELLSENNQVDWNQIESDLLNYIKEQAKTRNYQSKILPQTYSELLESAYEYYLTHFLD